MHTHPLHPARHASDTPARSRSVALPRRLHLSGVPKSRLARLACVTLSRVRRRAIRRLRHALRRLSVLLSLCLRLRSIVRVPRRSVFCFGVIAGAETRRTGVGVVTVRSRSRRWEVRRTGGCSVQARLGGDVLLVELSRGRSGLALGSIGRLLLLLLLRRSGHLVRVRLGHWQRLMLALLALLVWVGLWGVWRLLCVGRVDRRRLLRVWLMLRGISILVVRMLLGQGWRLLRVLLAGVRVMRWRCVAVLCLSARAQFRNIELLTGLSSGAASQVFILLDCAHKVGVHMFELG